jgi:hypothetical protein
MLAEGMQFFAKSSVMLMEDFYLSHKSNTYYLALVGVLMSIVLIVKAIFNFVIVLNGYPLDFYIVFYVLGMMLINKRTYA